MIRRYKDFNWQKKNYNPFKHIWLKSVFAFKMYEFWKCDFNKEKHIFN
jgi:hypothetical protein